MKFGQGKEINFAKKEQKSKIGSMRKQKIVECFEEIETNREYKGHFCSIRPAVKSCVSVFRQSQDWLWESGAVYRLDPLPPPFPRVRDGMRAVGGVNAVPGVGDPKGRDQPAVRAANRISNWLSTRSQF